MPPQQSQNMCFLVLEGLLVMCHSLCSLEQVQGICQLASLLQDLSFESGAHSNTEMTRPMEDSSTGLLG